MSVKFEQETIRTAPVPGPRQDGVLRNLGQRMTGGRPQTGGTGTAQPGYLAVRNLIAPTQ